MADPALSLLMGISEVPLLACKLIEALKPVIALAVATIRLLAVLRVPAMIEIMPGFLRRTACTSLQDGDEG
jgi:hypothetical protein